MQGTLGDVTGNTSPLHIAATQRSITWIESDRFGAERIRGGAPVPWLDSAELVAYVKKVDNMFGSDVISVDLAAVVGQYLRAAPEMRQAMGARERPGYALRVLLQDQSGPLGALKQAVDSLVATFPHRFITVLVPGPAEFAAWAAHECGVSATIDAAAAESAAVRIADHLRGLADCGVSSVLMATAGEQLDALAPIVNVSRFYGWSVGVDVANTTSSERLLTNADFVVADADIADRLVAKRVPTEFWARSDEMSSAMGSFVFAELPLSLEPEVALARIAVIKSRPT